MACSLDLERQSSQIGRDHLWLLPSVSTLEMGQGWEAGGVCGWCLSPWTKGQDLRACPQMRDGWQHDRTQVSRLLPQPPHAAPPLGKSLGLPLPLPLPHLLHLDDVQASARGCLLQSWAPHLPCMGSLPPRWDLSPECPELAKVSLGAHRDSGIGNAGPSCAWNWPEDILKKNFTRKV